MDPRSVASMFKWPTPNKARDTSQQDSHTPYRGRVHSSRDRVHSSQDRVASSRDQVPSSQDRVPFADDIPLRSATSKPNEVLKESRSDEVKEDKEPSKSSYASEGKRPAESILAEIKEKLILVGRSSSRGEGAEHVQQLKQTLNSLWVLHKCPTCLTAGRSHAFTCGHLVCRSCAEDAASGSAHGLEHRSSLDSPHMEKGKEQRKACPVCGQISETYQVFG
jgi:rubrerythrin